jgi:hypothetical protein
MSKEGENQLNSFYQDLIWVLESPPIFSEKYFSNLFNTAQSPSLLLERLKFFFLPLLKNKKLNRVHVLEFLKKQSSNRLGHIYESLLEFLFLNHPDFQIIQKGYVIQGKEGSTLGEFDFILYDSIQKSIIHLEVAIKFYLKLIQDQFPSSFIGTNFKDRMDKKILKLQSQIDLSSTIEGKQALVDFKNIPLQKIVLMQGILFYPWDETRESPEFLNENHLKGNFIASSHLKRSYTFFGKYLILPKLKWLASPNQIDWQSGMKFRLFEEKVRNHFSTSSQALFVARKDPIGSFKVFFVLPDSTPHLQ